jgi:predicted GNAT family acetyltransferase
MDVINNRKEGQFELLVDGKVARIVYEIKGKKIYLFSTQVPESLSGKGIGSKMLRESFELIEGMNLKVVPVCSFIQGWFLKHPENRGLLA